MTDIMIDIETLGTKPGCVVLSVGAVAFELDGEIVGRFYKRIDRKTCHAVNLVEDADTVRWWSVQSDEARAEAFSGDFPLKGAAERFGEWSSGFQFERIWAQGMDFDMPIWAEAMARVGVLPTWKFWQARDSRTVQDLANVLGIAPDVERKGEHHKALDDAEFQALRLMATFKRMREEAEAITHD